LKKNIREKLLEITENFIDYLGDDVFVEDIVLTGSLANYNWSEFSDFDLHVIVDYQQYEDKMEIIKKFFDARKYIFNENHDIKIYGYDVELYVQDSEEPHTSTGLYSVLNDEWINVPKNDFPEIDEKVLTKKINCWVEKINNTIKDSNGEKLETLKSKLKDYRKSGLDKEGEFSYENLVFKFLRRSGHIEKLLDEINKSLDKKLSIEQHLNEQILPDESNDNEKIFYDSEFLKSLKKIYDNELSYEFTPGVKIPYSKDVDLIQTALQYLGYSLPKWGVDGKYGPETENSVSEFQKDTGLVKNGKVGSNEIQHLIALLILKNFKDSDLGQIERDKEINTIGVTDKNFYERILQELGAPVSDENMKFLYAWRQSEGKAGRFNPFNTTHKMPNSTNFNKVGVKNYQSLEDGLIATLKTLRNGRYDCIINGMKNDIGAYQISKCPSLKVWGTGDLVSKVIRGYESGASPKVYSLA
jgi:peptidoglycan hydrolase-like protein with peptidoglycan-binding domain/predicted nucleotidyltransferase